MNNEIMVSIICNAYNHERYIRDALDSFLMQKTNFAFEVLVHDDASTDKTADIIREYEAKYPDIIKPIYQTENQYSKDNVDIKRDFQHPRALGKYIAVCEGDDYWTDQNKLQRQFDAMEQHPEVDICAHCAYRVDSATKKILDLIMPSKKDTILTVAQVIMGKGGYVATNSLFYRSSLIKTIPEFVNYLSMDYTLQIHGALRGGMLYLHNCMSAYRWMSSNSWSASIASSREQIAELYRTISIMLSILDAETNYRYTKTIRNRILLDLVEQHKVNNTIKELFQFDNRELFQSLSFITKAEVIIRAYFPWVVTIARGLYERITHRNET